MKIQCEKCGVHLDLAGYSGRTDVLTVKCTQCGHLIRGVEFTSESAVTQDLASESWRIRRRNGDVLAFDGLSTLRRWISEGRVQENDEVSADGRSWRPLSTLIDDPQLGLKSPKPNGPPPIPSQVYRVPANTLDAPDPEEELDASILSVEDRTIPAEALARRDLSEPLPSAVALPIGAAREPIVTPARDESTSTATGFVPLPSMAPDSEARGRNLDDEPTIRRDLPPSDAERLRTLDDQPTLNYTSTSELDRAGFDAASGETSEFRRVDAPGATLEPGVTAPIEPSLAEAVEHLVTNDGMMALKPESMTFADERDEPDGLSGGRPAGQGRFGAFVGGVFMAILLGGAGLYFAGGLPLDETPKTPQTAEKESTAPTVTADQAQAFAQAVSQARAGTESANSTALASLDALRGQLEGNAGATSMRTSIEIERARIFLAQAKASPAKSNPRQMAARQGLEALKAARLLGRPASSDALIEARLKGILGDEEGVRSVLELVKKNGGHEEEVAAIKKILKPADTAGDPAQNQGSRSPQPERSKETPATATPAPPKVAAERAVKADRPKATAVRSPVQDFDSAMKSGYRMLERGKVEQAREAFQNASKARPNRPEPYANLGWCSIETRQFGTAIKHFRRALSVRPRYSDALFGMGVAYEKQGKRSDAIGAFNQYLKYHPTGRKARMIKARLDSLSP